MKKPLLPPAHRKAERKQTMCNGLLPFAFREEQGGVRMKDIQPIFAPMTNFRSTIHPSCGLCTCYFPGQRLQIGHSKSFPAITFVCRSRRRRRSEISWRWRCREVSDASKLSGSVHRLMGQIMGQVKNYIRKSKRKTCFSALTANN